MQWLMFIRLAILPTPLRRMHRHLHAGFAALIQSPERSRARPPADAFLYHVRAGLRPKRTRWEAG
jgi:hypothetical protein